MKRLFTLIAVVCACLTVDAQVSKFEALYIFQFAKNTNWAAEDMGKDFVITIVGDKDVATELKAVVANKTVGNRKVVINEASNASNVSSSDIIYLGSSKKAQINTLVASQNSNKVLIVSGTEGHCANGAGIAFVLEGGKINFEISESNIAKNGLKVTPKLVQRGKQVL